MLLLFGLCGVVGRPVLFIGDFDRLGFGRDDLWTFGGGVLGDEPFDGIDMLAGLLAQFKIWARTTWTIL